MIESVNSLFQKSGNSVYNGEIRTFLEGHIQEWFAETPFSKMGDIDSYLQTFVRWIESSQNNQILGLGTFPSVTPCLGVTEALDQFHYQVIAEGRQLKVFRGEYPYNRDATGFDYNLQFIDDHPLTPSDAVVLSLPFSGDGKVHPRTFDTFETCAQLGIPLFLDMAWFGTCGGIELDLSHPGISQVAFSTTKGLTSGNYRAGIRFSRRHINRPFVDRLELKKEWNHSIPLNLKIATELMGRFSPDTQYEKFRSAQLKVCEKYFLEPSLCVHIATSKDSKWNEFSRDGYCNRINLREVIKRHV